MKWSSIYINNNYITWVINLENLIILLKQAMQYTIILYIFSQNKQGLPSIKNQIPLILLVKKLIRLIYRNIN